MAYLYGRVVTVQSHDGHEPEHIRGNVHIIMLRFQGHQGTEHLQDKKPPREDARFSLHGVHQVTREHLYCNIVVFSI